VTTKHISVHIHRILITDRWMLPAAIVAVALVVCITATVIAQHHEQMIYEARKSAYCASKGLAVAHSWREGVMCARRVK
jgi:hypothetical protein